jgi:hypothetical protein
MDPSLEEPRSIYTPSPLPNLKPAPHTSSAKNTNHYFSYCTLHASKSHLISYSVLVPSHVHHTLQPQPCNPCCHYRPYVCPNPSGISKHSRYAGTNPKDVRGMTLFRKRLDCMCRTRITVSRRRLCRGPASDSFGVTTVLFNVRIHNV